MRASPRASVGGAILVSPAEETKYVRDVAEAAYQLYGSVPNLYDPTQDDNYHYGRGGYRDHSIPGRPDYDPRYDKRTKVGAAVDAKATTVLQYLDWEAKLDAHKKEWDDHTSVLWGALLLPLPGTVAELSAVEAARVKATALETAEFEKQLNDWQIRLIGDGIVDPKDAPNLNDLAESRPKSILETVLVPTPTAPSAEGALGKAAASVAMNYLVPIAVVGAVGLGLYVFAQRSAVKLVTG
jgi:hypothetical protein